MNITKLFQNLVKNILGEDSNNQNNNKINKRLYEIILNMKVDEIVKHFLYEKK